MQVDVNNERGQFTDTLKLLNFFCLSMYTIYYNKLVVAISIEPLRKTVELLHLKSFQILYNYENMKIKVILVLINNGIQYYMISNILSIIQFIIFRYYFGII